MFFRPRMCRCFALLVCAALAGCASLEKYSFETFGSPKQPPEKYAGQPRSDALALIYADYVAQLLEGRSTGARLTRELSDSSLAIATTLTAAHETLKISAETLAIMGAGVLIVRDLQGIFNARGRSEAFADAAYLIRQAQAEYRSFNPEPSPYYMTENGATLVRRVDSALYAARKTLIGRMPTLVDLKQAHQAMTESGAIRKPPGTPTSLVTATGEMMPPPAPLPTPRPPVEPGSGVKAPQPATPEDVLIKQAEVQVSIDKLTGPDLPAGAIAVMDQLDPPTTSPEGKQTTKYSRDKTGLRKLVGKTRKIEDLNAIQTSL